ncbi:MAG TPA: hypothetical protein VK595_06540, partial [Vicinamibacterales bacterium]|nr:hypothetical protein [Vicinamibacterales bacterium]
VEWWTNDRKKTAQALREFKTDMGSAEKAAKMSHGPLRLGDTEPDGDAFAAHVALVDHVGNAVRRPTNMRDEADGVFLWLIGKESAKSSRKIDLAMCAFLSWTARGHAIRAGVLTQETFGRANWSGGQSSGNGRVDRSEYLPCLGCGKPIHPRQHVPGASEHGRCLTCRSRAGAVGSANW